MKTKEKKVTNYSIDAKVEEFMSWYVKNFVKGKYTDIGEYTEPRDMINSIEKMAVWYELRYPEYEVSKRYPGSSHDSKDTNMIYLKNNPAIKAIEDALGTDAEVFELGMDDLNWEDVLSPKTYISALPWSEKWFLARVKYCDIVNVKRSNHLHLTAKGRVSETEIVKEASKGKIEYYNFNGMHIEEVLAYLKEINYPIESTEIENAIKDYNSRVELKERFLDIVMYRIIERGGNRIGARRAFMFALDFNRNIDIPMTYGVDYSDPGLRGFIHEYIKAGGRTDLECLVAHGSRTSEKEPLTTVTVQEMILKVWANAAQKYTNEEKELHQRLVNALGSSLPFEMSENQPEEVMKKSLKRT